MVNNSFEGMDISKISVDLWGKVDPIKFKWVEKHENLPIYPLQLDRGEWPLEVVKTTVFRKRCPTYH